ncbi:MAG: DUF4406 domain-containing protein [Bacteroides sp.]|nr:DUF4406 domain-containing protein [Bacteroides sp.]
MMRKGKIYISLPITGQLESARQKAEAMAHKLSREGWEPINPFDVYAGKNPTYEDYLCYDIRVLMRCDAVLFCTGWEGSLGCCIEHDIATRYNQFRPGSFKIYYE